MNRQTLLRTAAAFPFTHVSWVQTDQLTFSPSLRDLCKGNVCGAYGTSWMGPPAIGPVEDLQQQILAFKGGAVVQLVTELEDSFDYPGMVEGKDQFEKLFQELVVDLNGKLPREKFWPLGAGCCHICGTCTYPDAPCLHPDIAVMSVEACGLLVNQMVTAAGLRYNNGPNTVSYVGLVLLDES